MRRISPFIAAALLMAVCLVGFASIGRTAQQGQQAVRWEYKVVEGEINFNALGSEGWELVTVYPGFKAGIYAYFKRPRR
jgi:hypothetical protein